MKESMQEGMGMFDCYCFMLCLVTVHVHAFVFQFFELVLSYYPIFVVFLALRWEKLELGLIQILVL